MAISPTPRVMGQLTPVMRDTHFKRGELIYAAGAPASHVYFIVSGEVELTSPDSTPWRFKDQSLIGILDSLLDRPYARTATAVSPVHAIALGVQDYFDVLEDNFEYARRMLVFGAQRHNEMAVADVPDRVFAESEPSSPASPRALEPQLLNTIERLLALRTSRFVQRAPVQALASLAQLAVQRSFASGATLFRQGEPAHELYLVVSGQVLVQRREPTVSACFAPVRLVAGLAALGYDQHYYDAVAQTETTTLVLAKEDLFDVAEDHFGLARAILAYSSQERERIMALRQARAFSSAPTVGANDRPGSARVTPERTP